LYRIVFYYYSYFGSSASDLPMRTIKLCFVVFGVTSSLSVINKIHWCVARRRCWSRETDDA